MRKYDKKRGKAGYVYIISNRYLMPGILKIGQTKKSGHIRAKEFNRDAKTGMPAGYECIFQQETLDCYSAEQSVHAELRKYREGKRGQEYFVVDVDVARRIIISACKRHDAQINLENQQESEIPPAVKRHDARINLENQQKSEIPPAVGIKIEPTKSLLNHSQEIDKSIPIDTDSALTKKAWWQLTFLKIWAIYVILHLLMLAFRY